MRRAALCRSPEPEGLQWNGHEADPTMRSWGAEWRRIDGQGWERLGSPVMSPGHAAETPFYDLASPYHAKLRGKG